VNSVALQLVRCYHKDNGKEPQMKLIYTDTDDKGNIDVVHAATCRDGKTLLRKARNEWNWQVFEATSRDEAFTHLDATENLGGLFTKQEGLHFCPCVTIQ
jgi:hypothetical protein